MHKNISQIVMRSMAAGALLLAVGFSHTVLAQAPAVKADAPAVVAAPAAAPAAEAAPTAAAAAPAAAAPAAEAAPAAAPAPIVPNKGDTAWMMMATVLVILMTIPGLALFYGGLVRSKNMLSVLMQVFMVFSVIIVLWAIYGYSLAFTEGNSFIGSFDRLFLSWCSWLSRRLLLPLPAV